MKRIPFILLTFCMFFIVSRNKTLAQDKTKGKYSFGGVVTCKPCHLTPKSGAQFKIWAASPHAKAYKVLGSSEANNLAKKYGVEDPQSSGKCLKCHVTAYGVDATLKGPKLELEEGVSCEACHGPGSIYKKRKIMLDIYQGKVDGAKYGLIKPKQEVCVKCHNPESPTFKGFKFDEMLAKIAHPIPKEKK